MYRSIVVSCDTYYYMLANDLASTTSRASSASRVGSRTGIDIEGEFVGVLPSPEWKVKRFKNPAQQRWFPGETISVGIGQGYNSYTPLQLAQAVATLANDGVMYRPHLVDYIENPITVSEPTWSPSLQDHSAQGPESRSGEARHGRGQQGRHRTGRLRRRGYVSAGKTGTAQVVALSKNEKYSEATVLEHLRDHALFIAFAPAEIADRARRAGGERRFGARAAAPVARKVLDYYLLGKRVDQPTQPPSLASAPTSRRNPRLSSASPPTSRCNRARAGGGRNQ